MVLFHPVWAVTDLGTNKLLKESHRCLGFGIRKVSLSPENLSLFRMLYVIIVSLKCL